jgi:hypothetical protein
VSNAGALGDIWDETAGAWATPPVATADQKILLSETDRVYTAGKSTSLGDVTSDVVVRLLGAADAVVGAQLVHIVDGDLVKDTALNISPVMVSPQRTWYLRQQSDAAVATNIVTVTDTTSATLAMDFSGHLNEGAALTAVSSVTDTEGSPAVTASNQAVSQDRRCVHFEVAAADLTSGNTHTFKCVVTTTDGDTLVGSGSCTVA